MDTILAPAKWQLAPVNLDDSVILCKSTEEHLQSVETVWKLLRNADVTLKVKNFIAFSDAIGYLGDIISLGRLNIVTKTTNAIHKLHY